MKIPRYFMLLLPLSVASGAEAAGKYWVCGDGVWDDGACWSLVYEGSGGAGEPDTSGDPVRLWSDDGLNRVVTYQTALNPVPDFSLLSIDAVNGGNITISHSSGALSTNTAYIGWTGNGNYALSGGSLAVGDVLSVGQNSGANGVLNVSGNGSAGAAWMFVGNLAGSAGTVNQTGGAVNVSNSLVVGKLGTGTYNLSGGSLTTNASLLQTAGSQFLQTGGVHTTTTDLAISNGSYQLQAGTLNVGGTLNSSATRFVQTGGSLVAGTIEDGTFALGAGATLDAATINGGDFTISGGSLSAGSMTLAVQDTLDFSAGTLDFTTLNLAGGAVTSDLAVPAGGTLNYSAGSLAGRLTNAGAVVSSVSNMTIADGLENNGVVGGQGFTFNGAGLANNASLQFSTSLDGAGILVNDGQMTGSGVLGGSGGFTNNGQFTQGAGDLVIGNTGGNTSNGTMALAFARQLTLNENLANHGLLTLNNSVISGSATLVNGSSATASGSGNVFAAIDNAGIIEARNGNLLLGGNSLTNTGLLRNTVGSNLFVGATTVSHAGSIEVNAAGSVVFSVPVTNGAGQSVTLKGGALGMSTLTNAAGGTVSGFGTLSGDMVNAGFVDLFGTSSLVGNLDNQAGGHFLVRNDQTLITGHTVNDGTIETLNGSVIFEGGLTNNGALLFDPSVITVTTLSVGAGGYLAETGDPGDRFVIQEDFVNASTLNTAWQTENTIFQFNGGAHDASNPQTLEVSGADLGNIFAGWQDNFMFGALEVGTSNTWLQLVDSTDNSASCLATSYCEIWSGEALYVDDLILHAGVTLDLNGFNLYVRNSFQDFGATILNGSVTVGAVPLPPAFWLFGSGLLGLVGLRCRGRRGLQASG